MTPPTTPMIIHIRRPLFIDTMFEVELGELLHGTVGKLVKAEVAVEVAAEEVAF